MVIRPNTTCVALGGSHETIAKLDEADYNGFSEKLKSILPPPAGPTTPEQGMERANSQLSTDLSIRNVDRVSGEVSECPFPTQMGESFV